MSGPAAGGAMAVGWAPVTSASSTPLAGPAGPAARAACGIVGWGGRRRPRRPRRHRDGGRAGADDPALMFTTRTAPQLAQVMWLEALVAWQFPHCHGAAVAMMVAPSRAACQERLYRPGWGRVTSQPDQSLGPPRKRRPAVRRGPGQSTKPRVVGRGGLWRVVLGVADWVGFGVADVSGSGVS